MSTATTDWVTVPALARANDVHDNTVRRVIDKLGLGFRLGLYRVVTLDEVPAIEAELERRATGRRATSNATTSAVTSPVGNEETLTGGESGKGLGECSTVALTTGRADEQHPEAEGTVRVQSYREESAKQG